MKAIDIMIEEYKTLRAESLVAMQTQQSILRFGTASVGVILAIGFQFWENNLSLIIFLFFLPVLSYLVLIIWMGEVARMVRAGIYLMDLEDKISSELKQQQILHWENWLRDPVKKPQLKWNYIAIIALFMIIASVSIALGLYFLFGITDIKIFILVSAIEFLSFLGANLFIYKRTLYFK